MTDSDELFSKADALLGRWRSGGAIGQPPPDYPVLTEVVESPGFARESALPGLPVPVELPAGKDSSKSRDDAPAIQKGGPMATPEPPSAIANYSVPRPEPLSVSSITAQRSATTPEDDRAASMDALLRRDVLQAIESRVTAYVDMPLRLRLDEAARRLAAEIATDVREDILAMVRDAVRHAVEREIAGIIRKRPDRGQ